MIELTDSSSPVSAHELDALAAELPVDLPREFVALYRLHNGGTPTHGAVSDGNQVFGVHEFYDVDDLRFFKRDLDVDTVPAGLDPARLLPFACDQGGNVFALHGDGESAGVCFYASADDMAIHGRWASFGEFLEGFLDEP
ncbi:SMI1/KNR4 family protein [Cellulomonas sp. APG4]|uniref:SMI1/KNR4 family protein n=1 Tax=Cellulomonas sp. APG4 TaxID=1538656 RepID=UPI00137A7865|nr:SMI1/KNR4 family protein [Cellulomonas sp. APG4]NCT92260.1 SMI1/KNR4 family protein [Cellulomonas sp. APG4]